MLSIIVDRAGNAVLFYTWKHRHLLTLTYEEIE
jgi:hypothetical protein